MATPKLSTQQLAETLQAVMDHGSITAAAAALGIPRNTFDSRYKRAKLELPEEPPSESFEVDAIPSELPTADELLKRRAQQFAHRAASGHHAIGRDFRIEISQSPPPEP